jgi:hypothetical protein
MSAMAAYSSGKLRNSLLPKFLGAYRLSPRKGSLPTLEELEAKLVTIFRGMKPP